MKFTASLIWPLGFTAACLVFMVVAHVVAPALEGIFG